MLLDDAGAECNARATPAPDSKSVVREPYLAIEQLPHVRDRQKIGIGCRRRIGARAFEQHEIPASGFPRPRTASSMSATVAIPVEIIIGLPVAATLRMRGRSVFSNDAIL